MSLLLEYIAKMSIRKNEDLKEEVKNGKILQGMSLSRVFRGILYDIWQLSKVLAVF